MKQVGITFGCFDLLHAGHVHLLQKMARECDEVIVGLHIDPALERPEKNKPVQTLLERYIQLEAIKGVTKIIPYQTEADLLLILQIYSPTHRYLGGDYRNKNYTGKSHPMLTVFVDRDHGWSTSRLRGRVVKESQ